MVTNPVKLEQDVAAGNVQYLDDSGTAQCAWLPMMWSNDQEHYKRAQLIRVRNWVMGDAVTPRMKLKAGTVLATFDRRTGIYANGEPHSGSHTVVFLRWERRKGVNGMIVAQQMAGFHGKAELSWTAFDRSKPYYANASAFSVVKVPTGQ